MMLRFLLRCGLALVPISGLALAEPAPTPTAIIVVTAARPSIAAHPPRREATRSGKRLHCATRGPTSAYDPASGVSFNAKIVRASVRPDATVLVLNDGGGRTCGYLPGRAELARHGVDAQQLRRRTSVTIDGFASRSNRRKILIQQLAIHPGRSG